MLTAVKDASLPYSTRRATRRSAETTAASRSCHTQVRCSLKWLPGDLPFTVRRRDCYRRSNAGFDRIARSRTNMVFVVRRQQEIGRKAEVSLLMCFIDLQKAYQTVDRALLRQVPTRIGVLPQMIAIIRQFHDGMRACVRPNDGVCSD